MKLDELKKIAAGMPYPPSAEQYEQMRRQIQQLGLDPDNLYQELEMSSPYVDSHRDISHSAGMAQLHSHTFYEIISFRSNCGAEYLVGSARYSVQKGDIVVVPPGVSHRPLLTDPLPEPYIRDVVWISPELANAVSLLFQPGKRSRQQQTVFLRAAGTKWEYICDLIHAGVKESEAQAIGWESVLVGNTIALMTHLKRAFIDEATVPIPAEAPELPDRAAAYIESHLARKITLEDAARHLYVSASTLSQVFRKKMGVSFYRFVTQRRLIAAKALILEGMALEQVGEQVGFSDYSSFYRAFRQEYGISPRQYRKLQQAEEPLWPPLPQQEETALGS